MTYRGQERDDDDEIERAMRERHVTFWQKKDDHLSSLSRDERDGWGHGRPQVVVYRKHCVERE